jgi:glutamine synthetase
MTALTEVKMKIIAEYIWNDGSAPTQKLRSKTKIYDSDFVPSLTDFPAWTFDGS